MVSQVNIYYYDNPTCLQHYQAIWTKHCNTGTFAKVLQLGCENISVVALFWTYTEFAVCSGLQIHSDDNHHCLPQNQNLASPVVPAGNYSHISTGCGQGTADWIWLSGICCCCCCCWQHLLATPVMTGDPNDCSEGMPGLASCRP